MSTKIGQFIGDKFDGLRKGALIHGPFEQTSGGFIDETSQNVVPFGTLLKYGSAQKRYVAILGSDAPANLAGIAVIEQAMAPNTYPGTATGYRPGQPINKLDVGSIAVEFSEEEGNDIAAVSEGDVVYLQADGKVGNKIVSNKDFPNLIFTGDVEGNLVGIKKLY